MSPIVNQTEQYRENICRPNPAYDSTTSLILQRYDSRTSHVKFTKNVSRMKFRIKTQKNESYESCN